MTALAKHSAETVEHGTPPEWLDMGRRVLGGQFDLDPASSSYWNGHHVRATRYIDAVEDGLRAPWRAEQGMRIICNPPGDGLVRPFFRSCVAAWRAGASVWWIGFSLEQLCYLQHEGVFSQSYMRIITRHRIDFLKGASELPQRALFDLGGAPDAPEPQGNPTHGTYLVLMPQDAHQCRRFVDEANAVHSEVF